jgi:tetratricopeptide (TPR) repeat protein
LCEEAAAKSLALFEKEGDSWRAALSRVLLAVEGVTGADAERSTSLLDEASGVFADAQDEWGQAVIGFVRMETALKTGREDEAVRIGRAAAATFRSLHDMWGLSAVLYHLGWGLRQFGRYDEAAPVLEEAIDVAQRAGLYNTVQWALADLAYERAFQGRLDEAQALLQRAAAASAHVGDGAGEVLATYGHGLLAHIREEWAIARPLYADAHEGFRRLGTPVTEGLALAGMARCDEAEGRLDAAEAGYTDALEIGTRIGEPALSASALEGLARLAHNRADAHDADRLASEAARLRTTFGRPAPPHERIGVTDPSGPRSA